MRVSPPGTPPALPASLARHLPATRNLLSTDAVQSTQVAKGLKSEGAAQAALRQEAPGVEVHQADALDRTETEDFMRA